MKKLFITGTDTEIGKTYVTGLIVKKLKEGGLNPGYYKAAASGNDRVEGELVPGDPKLVKDLSGIDQSLESMCPFVYETAVSPHLASRMEGNPVDLATVKSGLEALETKYDYITMEGSGGIVCPIRYDDEKIMLTDIIKTFRMPALIVADAGLGTINHVVLTATYLEKEGIPLQGIIFNHYIPGDEMQEDNLKMCEELTGSKVVACVKQGDRELDISVDSLKKMYK